MTFKPVRYLVRIKAISGTVYDYQIVSAFGPEKAIAWAALVHNHQSGGLGRDERLYLVEVVSTEPAVDFPLEGDFNDRMEW
jgi:hypothetical protein